MKIKIAIPRFLKTFPGTILTFPFLERFYKVYAFRIAKKQKKNNFRSGKATVTITGSKVRCKDFDRHNFHVTFRNDVI